MGSPRRNVWKDYSDVYTSEEIRVILNSIGVRIASETDNDYLCFCPFHGNSNTPSMTVSRVTGVFNCFNPSCGAAGGFKFMVARVTGKDVRAAGRLMASHRSGTVDFQKIIDEIGQEEEQGPLVEWDVALSSTLHDNLLSNREAIDYVRGRGFTRATIEKFGIGYSTVKKMITTPIHDDHGMLVGLVGRSIYSKRFMNSEHLPRNRVVFNLHRAKRAGGTAIICESAFDAMLLDQRGYHGAVAVLGGVLGREQVALLDRYFDTIIIATDFDDRDAHRPVNCKRCKKAGHRECQGHNPGRDLGMKIAEAMSHKHVMWACYSTFEVYPNGKKDVGDLTDEETRAVIQGSLGHWEYKLLGLY